MIKLPLQIIELEHDNFHILISGEFQDGEKCHWIIDTGASKSVMDVRLNPYYEKLESNGDDEYQSAGINQGMIETEVGNLFSLKFGELTIENLKVALIDLDHINSIYEKYTDYRIAGLIGGDVLKKYQCQIDYFSESLTFSPPPVA